MIKTTTASLACIHALPGPHPMPTPHQSQTPKAIAGTDKMVVNLEVQVKTHLTKIKAEYLTTIQKIQLEIIKTLLTVQALRLPIKIVKVIKPHQMVNHKVTQMKMEIYQLNQEKVVKIKEVKMEAVRLIQPVN